MRRGPEAQLRAMTMRAAVDNSATDTHTVGIGRKEVAGKTTKQTFVPLQLAEGETNTVDAAIGEMLPGIAYANEICAIGTVEGTKTATVNMKVCKHGRTSGYTEGMVSDIAYDAIIGMDHANPNVRAVFNDQIRIETAAGFNAFGLGGDSGSLVVQLSGQRSVGLYFAGPASGFYGIASPIAEVLKQLEVTLL